jgi:hypothetical protein
VLAVVLREEGLDGFDIWEGFHAKFAHETSRELVEVLVWLLRAVPDVPLVRVANDHNAPVWTLWIAVRRAAVVLCAGRICCHGFWKDLFVDIARWEQGLESVVWVRVFGIVAEVPFDTPHMLSRPSVNSHGE